MFLPSNITLSPGDSGEFVRELQRRLSTLNLYPAEALSGFYDGMTTSAVTSFQFQQGLRSDGIAGPETLRRLNGVLSGTTDSTPQVTPDDAATQAEAVQRNFHMIDTDAQAQPDAFTFTPPAPEDIAPPAVQQQPPVVPQLPPAQQPIMQFVQAAPAMPDPALLMQTQQATAPIEPRVIPQQSQQPQHEHTPIKMEQPVPIPQPLQQQPTQQQPVQEISVKPAAPQHPAPEPVKPVQPETQPAQLPIAQNPIIHHSQPQQPVPQTQPIQPPVQQQPIEKPLEFKPPAPQQPVADIPAKPIEPRAEQPRPLETKPQEMKPVAQPHAAAQESTAEAAPERQSLRQRFTGMMQRIADYMESKLSPSVMAEVQKIGMQLNERGIRELPLPQNETALPSPSPTPGRGQQQVER